MKISFWLYSSNLEASFDFYQKVFNLKNETFTNKTKTFFVPIDHYAELKISTLQKPLNEGNIEINEADIDDIYNRLIKNQLLQNDESDVEKLPRGTFSGPWDFPGGKALFLKDPDNHFIAFMEW
ncbi:VOC family protein [Flavobacterium sp.]|uniref:VOC family protein n=1 Tax=Flavobacterium sp. TaxID=239 RepID=UPI003D099918